MNKLLFSLLIIFFFWGSLKAQNPVIINQPYDFQSWIKVKGALQFPTGCGTPSGTASLNGADKKRAAIYQDSCNKKTYIYNPSDSSWSIIGGTPSLDQVLAVGYKGFNKDLELHDSKPSQAIIAVYNRDTTNDNGVARVDARAYRGKAVLTCQGGSHAFNGLQFYRFDQSPGSYLPYIDSAKTFELLQNPDNYSVPQLRNGIQMAFVHPNYDTKLLSFDTVGRAGFSNVQDPQAWIDLPPSNGAGIASLRLRPGSFSSNTDAGAINNTGTFLQYTDNSHATWSLNDQCRNAPDGTYSAPSHSFANAHDAGMSYSSTIHAPVISTNGGGEALGILNTNGSGFSGISFYNSTLTSANAFVGFNNAVSRFRIGASTGFSLDFEAGGFNDNNPTMRLTSGGNALVGTTSDNGYKLQVNGAISTITDSIESPINFAWINTDGKLRKAAVSNGLNLMSRGAYFGTPTLSQFRFLPNNASSILLLKSGLEKTDLSADSVFVSLSGSTSAVTISATDISNNHNSNIVASSSGTGKASISLQTDSLAASMQIKTSSDSIVVVGTYDVGTKTNSVYKAAFSDIRGYKLYTAILNQSSTSDPTATVLGSNQIGSIVWARTGIGVYTGTLSGAFTSGKTFLLIGQNTDNVNIKLIRTDANTVTIKRYDKSTGSASDGLTDNSVEIRVYP